MSEYKPLVTNAEAELLDMDDCVAGYLAGYHGDKEPGSDKSKSYWHGWRNGSMDGKHIQVDEPAILLAASVVRNMRAH